MRSYKRTSHTIYDLKVHLIWITKYRYEVLTKAVGYRTREIIRQVCDANNLEIVTIPPAKPEACKCEPLKAVN